ncbi:hypothetical protein SAMN05446037_100294 [Anaerovirgula multivorans]|uniref:Uncharacterized protein n=1 Tax=Anaerovirgula multivorans TaxID=312168 RepID=A0A239AJP0_9FIRM|nr:hypothetical protein [Anaerovirgula multivorans]SNR95887.1 hypothetical protein SAMN05446037_100294 [Anaerovirgula multivorans]
MNQQAWNLAKQIADNSIDGRDYHELLGGGIELIEKEGENNA